MSEINLKGLINNIKSRTNIYTPIVEAIVNSIDAVDENDIADGEIVVKFKRETQANLEPHALGEITDIEISDNGVGFTEENKASFDTVFSELKIKKGGKGYGRFTFLKYFDTVNVQSVYKDGEKFFKRSFVFGKNNQIVSEETIEEMKGETSSQTVLKLLSIKDKGKLDKKLDTIARKLLEKLLIFFINDDYKCPKIILREGENPKNDIILNDYFLDGEKCEIEELPKKTFTLKEKENKETFQVKIFKIFYARAQSSISLTADNREVTDVALHTYVPEFIDEFYDEVKKADGTIIRKNFTIKTYVLGKYLDKNVSLERGDFEFSINNDLFFPFSQKDIENEAAELTKKTFETDVMPRQQKKKQKINDYVNESAPWHKQYLNDLDYSSIPYNLSNEGIEVELMKIKFGKEQEAKKEIEKILVDPNAELSEASKKMIEVLTDAGKNDLAHYVCSRKVVLELFKKFLERDDDGTAKYEEDVHDIIFPMGQDSTNTSYESHNLWLLDERLVFSEYVASDKKISKKSAPTEPDLVVFDQPKSFRNGDNEFSNPLTIFEFKRPKRTAYAEDEDPINQVGGYLEEIRAGKYETPHGVEKIKVNANTPVYGYIICDITEKIKEFAKRHQLVISPDEEGYFGYHSGYGMYVQIISFKKLLKDANLRNKIFFKKLKIE